MEQTVLVVGEALVDVVRRPGLADRAYPGGSAANVAVALARLERPVRFATCFAEDAYGELIRAHLDGAGVRLAGDPHTVSRTSSALAQVGADGVASYVFDIDWRPADPGDVRPLAVHTSSIGAVLRPGSDDVVALLERLRPEATISYDINARPGVTGTGPEVVGRVEELCALADVVKASDEDLAALWPARSLSESLWALSELGPRCVLATRGAQGARFVAAGEEAEVAAVPAEVADTIGAGDTFGAGLLDALWTRDLLGADRRRQLAELAAPAWAECLDWAARCAAVTVSRPGADPPWRHELA